MTLGEYDYATFNDTPYPGMAKIIFVIFQIFIPILLFNMLIAMMGNTYASVNEKSEKEFLKMWAKIIMSFERSVPQNQAKEYLEKYSIRLTATERGVMVIKAKDKTRASQRKGALSNWKVHFILFYKLPLQKFVKSIWHLLSFRNMPARQYDGNIEISRWKGRVRQKCLLFSLLFKMAWKLQPLYLEYYK